MSADPTPISRAAVREGEDVLLKAHRLLAAASAAHAWIEIAHSDSDFDADSNLAQMDADLHVAITEIRKALSTPAQAAAEAHREGDGWLPIASAPRDGTWVLVWGGVAHWHDGRWKTLTGEAYPGRTIKWPVLAWRPIPQHDTTLTAEPRT